MGDKETRKNLYCEWDDPNHLKLKKNDHTRSDINKKSTEVKLRELSEGISRTPKISSNCE